MLSFDRSALEARAARVDGRLGADDPIWQHEDPRPAGDIHATGRLSAAGEGRFYFSGRFEGQVETECRRCLAPMTVPVADELHLLFAEAGDEEADDSDAYPLDPRAHTVDLRPALREQWLLAVPSFALCREDCQGLCPDCGADLNEGPCRCAPKTDRRWDALKAHRRDA
jgi:uncharacterized protein